MTVASNSPTTTTPTPNTPMARVALAGGNLERLRRLLTLLLAAASVVAFTVFLVSALEWRTHPFFGAMLNPFMVVDGSIPLNEGEWTGLNAGLQRLDQLVSIDGQLISEDPTNYYQARKHFREIVSNLQPDQEITVVVNRPATSLTPENSTLCGPINGDSAECTFKYRVQPMGTNDFIALFIVPFAVGVAIVAIGLVVFYLRPNQHAARMVAITCICLGVFIGGTFDVNNTYMFPGLWLLAVLFLAAPLATLALVFPVRLTLLYRYPWLQITPFVATSILAAVGFYLYLNPPNPQIFGSIIQWGFMAAILATVLLILNLLRRRRLATTPSIRDQSNTVLIGLALALAPIAFWIINLVALQLTNKAAIPVTTSAITSFFIMPAIALAYAVLQYRKVDTDKIISLGITYTLMLAALVGGYFLMVFGVAIVTRDTLTNVLNVDSNNPFLIAVTIFIIAVLFLPVRTYLQRRIDQLYYRKRTNYQERVEAFARKLASLSEFDGIIQAFRNVLAETLSPSREILFLANKATNEFMAYGKPRPETDVKFENTSMLVKLLNQSNQPDITYLDPQRPWPQELVAERSRINILKPLIIARLHGSSKDLIGFVTISAPRSENGTYQFEELRFIENLVSQLGVAMERALAVETLQNRVKELDVLSSVSQAVNFSIEFDDLLELIYAQTDRLVSASHFYIVLREVQTDKLYFAFFVEDDERYPAQERRRWLMGHDLYSEIVRAENPMRVDDYALAMKQRGSPIIYESPNLKAWMGVPLIAGSNTLGVLAVATIDSNKNFTDDQMKVFSDIGSLAATSLDKARLFAETNLRARQLGALNAISQKLASELNVGNLLEIITSSAVEILDAEAGSLLLNVDDDENVFEFKVAVGASGQHLIGQRFPRSRGLVGEVASSSKPAIVNDAANDPRWGGEVAEGEFSTTAVLAVPLIAQNKVIGVLEVLNKKGGGIYAKEDADLLTTFAGQAAVAIENARLFEMTDKQLTQRVSELQTLEKIDVELNRSLDLQKVSDITMRWAIANSSATAGVLGIVIGEAPEQQLQIVSMYGYNNDDYPSGAEGRIWPLNKGIVSRVMRTKQTDLSTDVKIDPSYIPSLHGSLCQMTVPMLSGGEINAILVLEKDIEPRLSLVDQSFIQRLAEHASIAIANAQINAELTRANESKSEFVSFVAHELKTPMTSMKGFADLLISGVAGKLNDQQNNFLSTIRSNIDRMNTLVSDLNDVTKLQTKNLRMEFVEVDFRNVVTETLRPLHRQIEEKGQQLNMQVSDKLPPILADQNRLIQVMTNLVSNAYKYTPPEGEILIRAEVDDKFRDSKGRPLGPMLHVSVKDNGIGMSDEDLAKLFTPYFRSENPLTRQQPGTGLGLTITQGIIQGHGGNIWVESQVNEGTTFNFIVPVVEQHIEPEKIEDATQPTR